MFKESFLALKKFRNLIVFFALTHAVFLVFGEWMSALDLPGIVDIRTELYNEIKELPYIKPLTGPLAENLPLKVLYTFAFNLVLGAFFSTTVTGLVFFIPYMFAVWRAFLVGILYQSLDTTTPFAGVVFYGTFILEFGAYSLSSAAGMDLGLSLIWPKRRGKESRKEAIRESMRIGFRLYVFVIILLFLGALWEMGWLHYLGPIATPEAFKINK